LLRAISETVTRALAPVARRVVGPVLDSSIGDAIGPVRIFKRFARQWATAAGIYEPPGDAPGAPATPGASPPPEPPPLVPQGEQRPVVVYTSRRHSSCKTVKAMLDEIGIEYREVDLTEDEAGREALLERTRDRTFPQIFVGEERLGGFDDLMVAQQEGTLQGLLYPQSTTDRVRE